jgi:ribose 5-phosphate isomerase B
MAQTIFLGADHAGFPIKQLLVPYLLEKGYQVEDLGCHSTDSVDYPLISKSLAEALAKAPDSLGILVCGSGIGVSIGANRFPHIRAALANDLFSAKLSKLHNNANVLCMGSRVIAPQLAFEIVSTWLDTPFEGERHQRRVDQLSNLYEPISC